MPAHRRHLTILSCDIVDSTGYAEAMDPEDFEVLMTVFHDTCKAVVESHRGAFAHHTGDGFIAHFGSPRTQGRNAQEAIACGRAVVEALSHQTIPQGGRIAVRIGIATGEVVLSASDGAAANAFAVGKPVHLAARMQSLASPGAVFVDSTTYDLARQNFEFEDRGSHALKGFAEPEHVWEAGAPRLLEFRFEERQEQLTPLVGRARELEALDACWRLVKHGTGQTVLISGESGIGKSRLVFEFVERAGLRPLVFQSLEGHENEPLHLWINHMRHSARIVLSETVEERRRKAGEFFDEFFPGLGWLRPVMVSLVAQDGDEFGMQYDANPAYKIDALRPAIVDYIGALKDKTPKIIVVEDAHWIDPSSAEVLVALIERAAKTSILVLATSRSDSLANKDLPAVKRLPIGKLSTLEALKLAGHVLEGVTIAEPFLARVVERSDGIPLYVEEMARAVSRRVEAPSNGTSRAAKRNQASDELMPIPDTLQGTLLARLDSLDEARELAQIASVIGQEFDVEVLSKLATCPADTLQEHLRILVDSGLVRLLSGPGATRLEFKHALIRQAAYNSLLRRDAEKLHSALVSIYERNFPEIKSTRPEMLAQHLTVSGRWLDAASLWLQAGLSAKDMGSTIEAMARLDRCLHCLGSATSTPEAQAIRMRCQMVRGVVISTHFGPAEPAAREALSEAAALATALRDQDAMVDSLTSLSLIRYNSADFAAAGLVAKQMVDYGKEQGNERAAATGKVIAGMCHFATGRFENARADLDEAQAILSGGNHGTETNEGRALVYLALTLHILGKSGEANRLMAVALELARHRRGADLAVTLGNSLYLFYMQSNVEQTRRICLELEHLSEEKGLIMWYHQARFFQGWADALEGARSGLEAMEASMNRFRSAHEVVEQSFFYGVLAERYLAAGNAKRALDNVERGLKLAERLGERFFEAPLLRLKAKCLTGASNSNNAKAIAELSDQAEKLVRQQGAAAWV